jgi:roundabout axon guidance receptor 2
MNGIAKFECVANGNPPPSVFWTKEGSQGTIS